MAKPKRFDTSFKLTLRTEQLAYLHGRAEATEQSVSEYLRVLIERDQRAVCGRAQKGKGKQDARDT